MKLSLSRLCWSDRHNQPRADVQQQSCLHLQPIYSVMKIFLVLSVVGVVLISGCTSSNNQGTPADRAKAACIQACQDALTVNQDLSNGPCLSNNIEPDWVCDVAHSPRTQIDNVPDNQCSEYGKTANHFVEVDPDCNLIRTV